jgi:hypothetical protein
METNRETYYPGKSEAERTVEAPPTTNNKNSKTPMKTLQDLFFNELADVYDAERRIAKALPEMAKSATRGHI